MPTVELKVFDPLNAARMNWDMKSCSLYSSSKAISDTHSYWLQHLLTFAQFTNILGSTGQCRGRHLPLFVSFRCTTNKSICSVFVWYMCMRLKKSAVASTSFPRFFKSCKRTLFQLTRLVFQSGFGDK